MTTDQYPADPAPARQGTKAGGRTLNVGRLLASGGITASTSRDTKLRIFVQSCLIRHVACDWGDLDQGDSDTNEQALLRNERVVSVYDLPAPVTATTTWGEATVSQLWIITEAGHSTTTVLWPCEY